MSAFLLVDRTPELSNFFIGDFMKIVDFVSLYETELLAA